MSPQIETPEKVETIPIPDNLKCSLSSLADKIDAAICTYGITREELFLMVSNVLDGNIDG